VSTFSHRLYQYVRYRPKSWWRVLIAQIIFSFGRTRVPVSPTLLDAEPTNHCNQKCPGCATGDGTLSRPTGMMKSDTFDKILEDLGGSINFTDLYCMGEPFLSKNIYRFIAVAKERGIFVNIDTNGILIDPDKLLDAGLDLVNFHISGTTQEIHEEYRVGGDLENILGNVRKLVEARGQRQDSVTKIRLGMIVFKQNEHQIQEFFAIAKELQVDESYLIEGSIPNSNLDAMQGMLTTIEELQVYEQATLTKGSLRRVNRSKCSWPWHGTSISWNGDVHPCCHDYHDQHKLGNIFEEKFAEIWNGRPAQEFRQRLLDADDIPMCRQCPGYGIGRSVEKLTDSPTEEGEWTTNAELPLALNQQETTIT